MDRMKRTLRITVLAAAALAFAGACSARTDGPRSAGLEEPATVDAGAAVQPVDETSDADDHSKTNPLEEPAFRALSCGNTYCDSDERCCRATGQCFPADCPDCCDGAREGVFGDGPEVFEMHSGPTDAPVREEDTDDDWIEHDIEPDGPEPNE